MNTRALCLVLAAMGMAGCANFSGLDTQGQRLDANTLQTGKSLTGVTLSSAAWPSADWWKSLPLQEGSASVSPPRPPLQVSLAASLRRRLVVSLLPAVLHACLS